MCVFFLSRFEVFFFVTKYCSSVIFCSLQRGQERWVAWLAGFCIRYLLHGSVGRFANEGIAGLSIICKMM